MTDQLQARLDRLLGWTPEQWLPMRRGHTPSVSPVTSKGARRANWITSTKLTGPFTVILRGSTVGSPLTM